MYTKLIESLREHAEWAHANEWETPITLGDHLEEAAVLIESLSAELEQVKRERDALMDELRGRCYSCANVKPYEKMPRMNVCEHIKVVFSGEGKRGCEYWQWRGAEADSHED